MLDITGIGNDSSFNAIAKVTWLPSPELVIVKCAELSRMSFEAGDIAGSKRFNGAGELVAYCMERQRLYPYSRASADEIWVASRGNPHGPYYLTGPLACQCEARGDCKHRALYIAIEDIIMEWLHENRDIGL